MQEDARRRHGRAALVLLHVVIITLLALPSAGSVTHRRRWKAPNTQEEFALWAERLGTTPARLEADAWRVARGYAGLQRTLVRPIAWYPDLLGLRQGWQMFASPQTHPAQLEVEVEVDGAWKALVLAGDPRSTWRAHQRKHNRFRKVVGRIGRGFRRARYQGLARWLATQAAHDVPEASRVRVRLHRHRTLSPEQRRAGAPIRPRFEHELVFDAEALR